MSDNRSDIDPAVVAAAQKGDKVAIAAVVDRMEPFIRKATYRLEASSSSSEDLAQDVRLAILKAIPKFDPSRGFSIETFLYLRIHGAVKSNASSYYQGVNLNHSVAERYYAAVSRTESISDAREYAKVSGVMSNEAFDGAHAAITGVWSIDYEVNEPSTSDFQETITTNIMVRDAVAELGEPKRAIITLAFGLDDGDELNDREIGELLDIERSWVYRQRMAAMAELAEVLS